MKVCALSELPEVGAKGVAYAGQERLFVVRREGCVYAYHDACPHYGDTTLPWRQDAYLDPSGEHIMCAAHGALFEISTGRCVSGPCEGQYLTSMPVYINDADEVVVTLNGTDSQIRSDSSS
ncbi:Rieske (2Fe-2S) protein [Pseudomaricurvus alkylphenolicus]|nr:Rieske (2Fe-2S) protein [Pseudomaricurvus alkylphenolicus]